MSWWPMTSRKQVKFLDMTLIWNIIIENWIRQEQKHQQQEHLSTVLFWIGQILNMKCATRVPVETNENLIVMSQWKFTVTLLVMSLPKHVLLLWWPSHRWRRLIQPYMCEYIGHKVSDVLVGIIWSPSSWIFGFCRHYNI